MSDTRVVALVEEMRQSFIEARDAVEPESDAWLVWHAAASNLDILAQRIRLLAVIAAMGET